MGFEPVRKIDDRPLFRYPKRSDRILGPFCGESVFIRVVISG